jgi:hypothetical protein
MFHLGLNRLVLISEALGLLDRKLHRRPGPLLQVGGVPGLSHCRQHEARRPSGRRGRNERPSSFNVARLKRIR